ncbi:MAG: PAS domain-containing sensor histidine kinase [Candidatus Omnitrophota bacterium]
MEMRNQKNTEEKYRELVENANSIILRMDTAGKVIFLNEFGQNFFGYKEKDILGKSVIGTIVPSTDISGQSLEAMVKDIMDNPQKYINNENENVTRNSVHVWVSWTNKPIFDEGGVLKEVLCIGNDITALKNTQAALVKAKELAESASMSGTVICEPDWKIRHMNAAAKRYFDIDGDFDRADDFLCVMLKKYEASIAKDQIIDPLLPYKTFDLIRPETENIKALYLQVNMEVLRNPQHEVSSIVMVMQNVTDARLEELMKQDFMGLVSHKLRTPLSAILGNASILQQENNVSQLNDKQKRLIDSISRNAYSLSHLIDKLLKFTEMNKVGPDQNKEGVDLCEFLPSLAAAVINEAKDKKIEFQFDCLKKDSKININKESLDIIITNLIENAVKFNDNQIVRINISVKESGEYLEISILDNGVGIPPENVDKVLNGFYQVEKYFTGNVAGVGLGLLLVKRFVNANGGTLDLKSEIGKGTSFIIKLPR